MLSGMYFTELYQIPDVLEDSKRSFLNQNVLEKFLHVILNDMQSYTPGRQLYLFLYPPLSVEFSLLICCKYYEFDFICINTCLRISFFDVEGGGFDQTSFFHPCCLICNLSGIVFFFFFFFLLLLEKRILIRTFKGLCHAYM